MQRMRTLSRLAAGVGLGAALAAAGAWPAHAAPGPGYDLEDDQATTTVDTTVEIDTLANDAWSLPEGSHGWFDYLQSPTEQGGTVTDAGYGYVYYTPPPGFVGTDTFEYGRTEDVTGEYSDTATVTITVTAADNPPVPMIAPGIAAVGLLGGGALLGAHRLRDRERA
ncbi:Ig-like domain-containing protein [Promicromonospora sp. MEB111]|uniref:Ig-like domain-containing protein n=1 Tax=Promicromonospora sp. MEB111 TaxID=3040301 RepID=UPI00254DF1C0|nr:Ig-like domain-containing protein [Promicromonospora sp. MEB111]